MNAPAPAYLITDHQLCGIELPRHLAPAVTAFLCANRLDGLVVEIAGGRQIHIAQGHHRAGRATEALKTAGAVIHTDTARFLFPDDDELSLPPVVVIAAALRSVSGGAKRRNVAARRRHVVGAA